MKTNSVRAGVQELPSLSLRPACMALASAASALVVLALGFSSPAWALCPNCLAQTRTLTPTLELLGVFLLVPFFIAYAVLRVIRRVQRDADVSRR